MGALFVGLTTVDIAYLVADYPAENSKSQATQQFIGAGGPAANAAIAYSHLAGTAAALLTGVGTGPFADIARADLVANGVDVTDAGSGDVPVSSIVVARRAQSRTVVSLDAARMRVEVPDQVGELVAAADIVLVDGHYGELALAVARLARSCGIAVVLDAGRRKDVHAELLPWVDVAICSADFLRSGDIDAVRRSGPSHVAVTAGAGPIEWLDPGGRGDVAVIDVGAVDTLGAGDILHGAFCHFYSSGSDFVTALERAADVASASCRYFGTREWMRV